MTCKQCGHWQAGKVCDVLEIVVGSLDPACDNYVGPSNEASEYDTFEDDTFEDDDWGDDDWGDDDNDDSYGN